MKNKRLSQIKKRISLEKHKSGHLIVISKIRGCRFKRLTNIKSNLTAFEKNVVLIYMYKIIDNYFTTPHTVKSVSSMVNSCNYANVFGGPWLIEKQEE